MGHGNKGLYLPLHGIPFNIHYVLAFEKETTSNAKPIQHMSVKRECGIYAVHFDFLPCKYATISNRM